jgi:uncharacterized membrane protein
MSTTVSARHPRAAGFLAPKLRKLVLTVHVIASVAWIGGSLCLAALDITGLLTDDLEVRQAAYVSAGIIGSRVTSPVSLLAFASGVLISVGTKWGLFRYWWVLISLIATGIMVLAVQFALAPMLSRNAAKVLAAPDATGLEAINAAIAPCVATVVLSLVTAINVYKPWGPIRRS